MNKGRMEALTDGIIAIAATIMVLELKVPATPDWNGLAAESSTFIAYIVSFLMIASCWHSHHDMFEHAQNISSRTYFFNILWIMPVTLLPFVSAYIGNFPNAVVPSLMYELDQFLCYLMFKLLGSSMRKDNPDMGTNGEGPAVKVIQCAVFIICMALIPFWPPLSLVVTGLSSLINFIVFIIRRKYSSDERKDTANA